MAVSLLFAPLAYGTVQAWSQAILLTLLSLTIAAWSIARIADLRQPIVRTVAYVPMVLFLLLCVAQLVPWPTGVVRTLSPHTERLTGELLAVHPTGDSAPPSARPITPDVASSGGSVRPTPDTHTLSLYPLAGERDLRWLFALSAVFVLTLDLYRDRERLVRLLRVITAVGAVVAAMAVYQNLTGGQWAYGWRGAIPARHPFSGPFLVYSHFGQFMNLSIGAAAGLLLIRLRDLSADGYAFGRGYTLAGLRDRLAERDCFDVYALIVFLFVAPITVFLSMTRAGTLSLTLATATMLTVRLLTRHHETASSTRRSKHVGSVGASSPGRPAGEGTSSRRRRPGGSRVVTSWGSSWGSSWEVSSRYGLRMPEGHAGLVLATLLIGIFAALLLVGFDRVFDRMATLRQIEQASGGRFEILRDVGTSVGLFPLLGTGLGTFRTVFPTFDRSSIGNLASHAENEYAQVIFETGIIGMTLVLAFLLIVGTRFVRAVRVRPTPVHEAAYGLGLGVVAILIHSLSDFGQHLPSVALLTAICLALIVRLAYATDLSMETPGSPTERTPIPAVRDSARSNHFRGLRWGSWAGAASAVLVSGGVATWALRGAYADAAAERHWGRAMTARQTLEGRDWLGDERAFTELLRPATLAVNAQPRDIGYRFWRSVWQWEAIARGIAISAAEQGGRANGVLDEVSERHTRRVMAELQDATRLCPTYGPAYAMAGQLRWVVLGDPAGREQIRTSFRLAPHETAVAFLAGRLTAEEGDAAGAYAMLSRSVDRDDSRRLPAITLLVGVLNRPDLAERLTAGRDDALRHLADQVNDPADAARYRTEADSHVFRRAWEPDASARDLAAAAELRARDGQPAEAIDLLRRSLARDYGDVETRLRLAHALIEAERFEEAVHEARVCLRLRPQDARARTLLDTFASRLGVPPPVVDGMARQATPASASTTAAGVAVADTPIITSAPDAGVVPDSNAP